MSLAIVLQSDNEKAINIVSFLKKNKNKYQNRKPRQRPLVEFYGHTVQRYICL